MSEYEGPNFGVEEVNISKTMAQDMQGPQYIDKAMGVNITLGKNGILRLA